MPLCESIEHSIFLIKMSPEDPVETNFTPNIVS